MEDSLISFWRGILIYNRYCDPNDRFVYLLFFLSEDVTQTKRDMNSNKDPESLLDPTKQRNTTPRLGYLNFSKCLVSRFLFVSRYVCHPSFPIDTSLPNVPSLFLQLAPGRASRRKNKDEESCSDPARRNTISRVIWYRNSGI